MDSLSLLELNALVRRSLEQCLPDEYWIQAELSDVRSNTTGHCYLEFVQKDPRSNNLVAKARGMIWSNIYRLLKPYFEETTGQLFASGIKVLVKVTVQFHELYGYSLTVLDIDPAYTLGDMARRRREILMQLLAAACAQFPLPVITGIGHERDDTVLDSVAHTRVKTPTAAAELLIHRITESADHLEELSARLQQGAYALLEQEGRRLEMIQTRIPNLVHRKLTDARFALLAAGKDLAQATQTLLSRHRHRLELLRQRVADASPDKLLSRGYSITLKDGKAVTDAASLNPGDQLVTRLAKGSFTSEVRHR